MDGAVEALLVGVLLVVDLARLDPFVRAAARNRAVEQSRNLVEPSVARDSRQRVAERIALVARIVSAALDKYAHELEMPFAHRKMQRRRVVVLARRELGSLRHQLLRFGEVARERGR